MVEEDVGLYSCGCQIKTPDISNLNLRTFLWGRSCPPVRNNLSIMRKWQEYMEFNVGSSYMYQAIYIGRS